jgi:hypothetical protein
MSNSVGGRIFTSTQNCNSCPIVIAVNRFLVCRGRHETVFRPDISASEVAFSLHQEKCSAHYGTSSFGYKQADDAVNRLDHLMKIYLTYLLASVVFLATLTMPVTAQQRNSETAPLDKVKAKVAKLGVGEKAKATVILKDGTKKKGYIAQAGNDDFVLRDRKTDAPTTIGYSNVAKVESNKGHSTARNLGIGIGIGAGAFLAILLISIAHLD